AAGDTQAQINAKINTKIGAVVVPDVNKAYVDTQDAATLVSAKTYTDNSVSSKADKTNGATQITDPTAYPTIGSAAGATQAQINALIETKIGIGGTGTYVEQDLDTEYFSAAGGNKTFIVIKDIVDDLGVIRNEK